MSDKPPSSEWVIRDVRIAGVSFTELGDATVELGWVAEDAEGKPMGFGQLTLHRLDGWDVETESLGADFAKKVLAYIVDNGRVVG